MSRRLQIVTPPHPALKARAEEVDADHLHAAWALSMSMRIAMAARKGVGLAANQVGRRQRVIVWKVDGSSAYAINPVFEPDTASGQSVDSEGCLSLPGVAVQVRRWNEGTLHGTSGNGLTWTLPVKGLLARVVQHEIDHLNGITLLDHASA